MTVVVLASFFIGSWLTWAIPLAAAALVWTFILLAFGLGSGGSEDDQ